MTPLPRQAHRKVGYLAIYSGSLVVRFVELFTDTGRLVIGRDVSCDLRFDLEQDLAISRRHACLEVTPNAIYLEDIGSSNGTWVNGSQLAGRRLLRHGDVVSLGGELGSPQLRLFLGADESHSYIPGSSDLPTPSMSPRPRWRLRRSHERGSSDLPPPSMSPPQSLASAPRDTGSILLAASHSYGGIPAVAARCVSTSELVHSWLGVDAPVELALGATGLVRAVAIRDALKEALVRGALSQPNSQLLATLLGPAVKMKLVACNPQDFQIQPITPSKQRVRGSKLSVWEWLITAREPGDDKVLLLAVSSLTMVNGRSAGESMPSRQLRIRVVVTRTQESLVFPTSGLRKLLQATLRTDGDFEGFCLDYFPSVHLRFSNGMDRVAKLNLLLALEKGSAIVSALKMDLPTQFAEQAPDCAYHLSSPPQPPPAAVPRVPAVPAAPQQPSSMATQLPSPDFPLHARTMNNQSQPPFAQRRLAAIALLGTALAAGLVGWLLFRLLGL